MSIRLTVNLSLYFTKRGWVLNIPIILLSFDTYHSISIGQR